MALPTSSVQKNYLFILAICEDYAQRSKFIRHIKGDLVSFGVGNPDKINEIIKRTPYMWISDENSTILYGQNNLYSSVEHRIRVYIADKEIIDEINQDSGINQCKEEIMAMVAELRQHPYYLQQRMQLVNDIEIISEYEVDDDFLVRAYADLTIKVPFDYTYCSNPTDAIPLYNNDTISYFNSATVSICEMVRSCGIVGSGATPSLMEVLAVGNNANNIQISNTSGISFNQNPVLDIATGVLYWDSQWHDLIAQLDLNVGADNNIRCAIGQNMMMRINAVENISKGQCVYLYPGSDDVFVPNGAVADITTREKSQVAGIAIMDINSGGYGWIMTKGFIENIDTTLYNSGGYLYLGAAGTIHNSKNSQFNCLIGHVTNINASNGTLNVDIHFGMDLTELDGTDLTNPVSGDVLYFDGSSWINSQVVGPTGAQGVQGTQGNQGFQGPTGSTGAQGTQGTQGTQGNQGFQGPIGITGSQGSAGAPATPGAAAYGEMYVNGNTQSLSLTSSNTYYKFGGSWLAGDLNGFTFASDHLTCGITGSYLLNFVCSISIGSSNQNIVSSIFVNGISTTHSTTETKIGNANDITTLAMTGVIGNINSGDVIDIRFKNNTSSGKTLTVSYGELAITAIQGAKGDQGFQGFQGSGATGSQGPVGSQGTQGTQGKTGPNGATGSQGVQGPQGVAGSNGANGATGSQGVQGPQGVAGSNGATGSGTTGATGSQGTQGPAGSQGATGPAGATGSGSQGSQGPTGPGGGLGYTIMMNAATHNPGASNIYYIGGNYGVAASTIAYSRRIPIPKAGTIKAVEITSYIGGVAASGQTGSFNLRLNNTTDTLITSVAGYTASVNSYTTTGLSIAVVQGDFIEIKNSTPAWSPTLPTTVGYTGVVYIE